MDTGCRGTRRPAAERTKAADFELVRGAEPDLERAATAAPIAQPRRPVVVAVEGDRLQAPHLDVELEVVLQVGADARAGRRRPAMPVLGEVRRRADPRQHQELRRVDRRGGEDHLAPGGHRLATLRRGRPRRRWRGRRAIDDPERRGSAARATLPPAQRRAQVGVGRRPAPAAPDGLLHRAEAFLLLAVVVVGELEARLRAGLDEGCGRAGCARGPRVTCSGPSLPRQSEGPAVPVLHPHEVGHDVGPAPAVGAHLGPGSKSRGWPRT